MVEVNNNYHISANSFRRKWFFFELVTVHKSAEAIQGRKLFKGGNYTRKYSTWFHVLSNQKILKGGKPLGQLG